MTAAWVGGGTLNGAAEAVFTLGLLWCHAPLGYAISLFLGGWLFAAKMRITASLTMLDPFQKFYGPWIGVMLCVPAVCGEIFWTASMLSALGHTIHIIANLNYTACIVVSAVVVLFYTSLGGLYSVLYTDVLQIGTTAFGLWTCVPYFLTHPSVRRIGPPSNDWLGKLESRDVSQVLDFLLMTIFGGIPWQAYFQRVLAADSVLTSKMLSYLTSVGFVFFSVPPIIIGAVAKSANFTSAGYPGPFNLTMADSREVLPLSIHYMTPKFVAILGLIAITAAIMSSVDSSMLSAGTLIARNIYHFVIRPTASDVEVCMVLRFGVLAVGSVATFMATGVTSVFAMWALSSDLVYVLLFPQFVALFYLKTMANAYGAVTGFVVGIILRLLCGEPHVNLPVTIRLPFYSPERGQEFPFRTLCI
ncbi:high-affinity choline transporter 1-like, partial [Haemaphysalis longicornis]